MEAHLAEFLDGEVELMLTEQLQQRQALAAVFHQKVETGQGAPLQEVGIS